MRLTSITGFETFSFLHLPPTGKMREGMEFYTDIITSQNGSEDRSVGRTVARHTLSYGVNANLFNRQFPFNLGEQNIRGNWAVPIWSDVQTLTPLPATTNLAVDPYLGDFRAGSLVLAFVTSDDWQIRKIASVGANSITLDSAFSARPFAYIVPVNAARLRGDIDFQSGSFTSDFNFDVSITNPKPYPTKLGILFACDVSGSMLGSKLTALKADLTRALQDLRGAVVNSGVRVDLCLCLWGASESTLTYPDATAANIDTAIAAVAAIGSLGGTVPLLAFNRAVTFFGTSSPNPNDRKDIMFFSTDAVTSLTSSRAAALDLITRVSPYNGRRGVDIYAIGIELGSFSEFDKVDNASKGAYSNVDSVTPFAMSDRFLSVLAPIIGYQFNGYEIVTRHPNSDSGFSRTITQREDIFDTDLAPYVTRTPWTQSRVKSNHPFLFEGGEESVAIRQFLYRRQGAARLFYMPTFQHDLPAYAISNDLTQINVPNLDIRSFDANRVDVAIQFTDGTWQGNRITSITADLFGGWLITFARALRRGLAEVRQISYMGLSRFETDRIEMQWVGNRAITMSINMVEIDK